MEDDIIFFLNEDDIHFLKMEDDLIFYKLKMTSFFGSNGRLPQYCCEWKMTSNIKTNNATLIRLCNFKEQHSYFSQPDQHTNPKSIGKQKPNQP